MTAVLSMLLYGALGPLAGRLADRYGPKWVLTVSVALAGVGALLSSTMSHLWQFHLYYGVITSIGAGGAAMVTAAAMTSRWFAERRALVMGLAGAGVSAGQLAFLPLAAHLEMTSGWRWSFAGMGLILLFAVLPVVWLFLRDDPAEVGLTPYGTRAETERGQDAAELLRMTPLREALRSRSFWLLLGSFFVCGYTSTGLIGVHLIPHAVDHGFPKMVASGAMGLMGAMNVVGTTASGYIADRYGKRIPLAIYYFLRGLSLFFLLGVASVGELNVFAIIFGLNYSSATRSAPPWPRISAAPCTIARGPTTGRSSRPGSSRCWRRGWCWGFATHRATPPRRCRRAPRGRRRIDGARPSSPWRAACAQRPPMRRWARDRQAGNPSPTVSA
jgi:MFS family permease